MEVQVKCNCYDFIFYTAINILANAIRQRKINKAGRKEKIKRKKGKKIDIKGSNIIKFVGIIISTKLPLLWKRATRSGVSRLPNLRPTV